MHELKKVLIVGGSGLIGKHLADYFGKSGYEVFILSRNPITSSGFETYSWNPSQGILDAKVLSDKDIIINLSGAGIEKKIWTPARKRVLYNSRINSTRLLVDTLIKEDMRPELFMNASAIGYYGNRPDEKLTEKSKQGNGFLSTICYDWENEVRRLEKTKLNHAILRIGIVLSNNGGSLPKLMRPIKMRFNVLFGKGSQCLSWIHMEDIVRIFFSIASGKLKPDIYNCVSPNPVTQKDFNDVLMKTTHVRAIQLRLPKKMLSLMMGEMSELFLSDLNVYPENLLKQKFQYDYPNLTSSIKQLFKNPNSKFQ